MWPFKRNRMSDGEIISALLEENDMLKQKCAARGELLRRAEERNAHFQGGIVSFKAEGVAREPIYPWLGSES